MFVIVIENWLYIYRRFWYQVFTWQSLNSSLLANSMRSWTLRYFWRSKDFSSVCNWWSVKAVRALRCFFVKPIKLSPLLILWPSSSLAPAQQQQTIYKKIIYRKSYHHKGSKVLWTWNIQTPHLIWSDQSIKIGANS